MPQLPFQLDGVQIEPGSGQTLTITRDNTDGSLKFIDAILTLGVTLKELVGIRNIQGVYVVGKTNAPYTTIQSAIDAVPEANTSATPALILVGPGIYQENLLIQKDGVVIKGFGGSKILNSGNSSTVSIYSTETLQPKNITFKDIEIECTQNGKSCVEILGAYVFATGEVTAINSPLAVGDTLTINGTVLTGVVGNRTSGLDNFSVDGGTAGEIATEISAALNDTSNSFASIISATPVGAVITIKSNVAGSPGNAITLATSTTPGGGINLSGATLTGGSSNGSEVASEYLTIDTCNLKASGVGSYQIYADTVNYIRVLNGSFWGSSSTSITLVSNCSTFELQGTYWANDLELSYDTGNDVPLDATSLYQLNNCQSLGDFTTNLVGAGSIEIKNCNTSTWTSGGDQDVFIYRSSIGTLSLSDTITFFLEDVRRGIITIVGGTPLLEEDVLNGTSTFAGSVSEDVSFGYTQTDTNYFVFVTSPDKDISLGVISKTTTGFTIEASASLTGDVEFLVRR